MNCHYLIIYIFAFWIIVVVITGEKRLLSIPSILLTQNRNKLFMKITSKKISIEFVSITNNWQNNDEQETKQQQQQKQEATSTATAAKVFTKKVNANCFKLHRSYSHCFNFSNVGDFFSRIELLKTVSKFATKTTKSLSYIHVLNKP